MEHFHVVRQDLDRMWHDINNLFDEIDSDIIHVLNRYPSSDVEGNSSVSVENDVMPTITEEPDAEDSNSEHSAHVVDSNYHRDDKNRDDDRITKVQKLSLPQNAIRAEIFNKSYDDYDRNVITTGGLLHTISMQRIIYVMCEYHKYLTLQTDYDRMYDFISSTIGDGHYSLISLLNDFYFVLKHPDMDDAAIFGTIYKFVCAYIKCHGVEHDDNDNMDDDDDDDDDVYYHSILTSFYVQQNQYEKCISSMQREHFYGNYSRDSREIVTLQILNRIFFYFLHSFDLAYKLEKVVTATQGDENADDEAIMDAEMVLINERIKERRSELQHKYAHFLQRQQRSRSRSQSVPPSFEDDSNANMSDKRCIYSKYMMLDAPFHRDVSDHSDDHRDSNINDENEQQVLNVNESENENVHVCTFGRHYKYWLEFSNDEWFVYAKHGSFKDELLCNSLYHISSLQWNDVTEEAKNYQQCNYGKSMQKIAEILHGHVEQSHIGMAHIMALLLYTNFNVLRVAFLKTYYRRTNESSLALKSRHSNFAIFARLLSECVQWYGDTAAGGGGHDDDSEAHHLYFYHIINASEFVFHSTTVQMGLPFSVSSNLQVMLAKNVEIEEWKSQRRHSHSQYQGMLLKMRGHKNVRYFETAFLSKFVNEDEVFLIGGDEYLYFDDILSPQMGDKFAPFLKALNIVSTIVSGDWYKGGNNNNGISDRQQTLVLSLLNNRLLSRSLSTGSNAAAPAAAAIPEYMSRICAFYCLSVHEISIDWTALHCVHHKRYKTWSGYQFCTRLLCLYDTNSCFVNLNVLQALFENVHTVNINTTRYHSLCLSEFVVSSIYNFVLNQSDQDNVMQVRKIVVKKPVESTMSIQDAINNYYAKFKTLEWSITQTQDKYNDKYLIVQKL